jgi:calcium-translocating P-type ATPase
MTTVPPPRLGRHHRSVAGGLTSAEAERRLARDGPNRLPPPRRPSAARALAAQMTHFFALMLWGAAGLALAAGMPSLAVGIAVVVVVNGVFAFAQEHRAERAAERLRELLPVRATVVRDGRRRVIDATGLVVGDLVVVEAGDRVSADMVVVEADALMVDTSLLTGESVPAPVGPGDRLFAGSFVVEGDGAAEVVATGTATRLAAIAALTRAARRPPSPLTIQLHGVVRTIATVAVAVGLAFLATAALAGLSAADAAVFAIGVTVALVPEGLLPTVTLSLAISAQRMARRHALVRHLDAVETLGSTSFICTDKTGTLTVNQMTVVAVWTPAGTASITGAGYGPVADVRTDPGAAAAIARAALAAARCSTGHAVEHDGTWVAQGDPMEAAIDALAHRLGIDVAAAERAEPVVARMPFDTRRRRTAVVAGDRLFVKGAPEAVLPVCRPTPGAAETAEDLAARGLRVLAVASRAVPEPDGGRPAEDLERDLDLLGLLGIEDPPRPEARAALDACRRAGVRVAMVTGDHPATARAVAAEVGLVGSDGGLVLTGAELPPDDAVLGALLDRDGVVVARVTPEDKLRIARALQARGHVVAMTGDGVNDAPALREADVGVAMGRSGTDVAREAADLVLLDDDFATIVAAVREGRATFANIRRFLTYHLTDNVAELTPFVVWALSGGGFPLALGVLQVLSLDIGTDLLPALALGAEPPGSRWVPRPDPRTRLLDGGVLRRAFAVLGPAEATVEMAAFLAAMAAAGWRPGTAYPAGHAALAASGAAFCAVVLGQMANAFACRSASRPAWAVGWRSNRLLLGAVGAELAALAGFLFVPPVAHRLGHAPPPLAGALVALAAIPAVLAADAADKFRRARARP